MTFTHANLTLFSDTIRQLESQDCCAVETGEKLKRLGIVLRGRLADDFISESVSVLLFNLSEEGLTTKEEFLKISRIFYSAAVAYQNVTSFKRQDCFSRKNVLMLLSPLIAYLMKSRICNRF